MSSSVDIAAGGKASVDAEREKLGEGIVENDSERPVSGKEGTEDVTDERRGVAGADEGPDEANMKYLPHVV